MKAAKAWVALLAAFGTALLAEWTGGPTDPLTVRDVVIAAVAALGTFGVVYATTNKA